ncbi:MAG TPA: S8 family serine peptidase [Tahibacter sp.]|nr:S8 family serine peptidase [Tahibacter sp.]
MRTVLFLSIGMAFSLSAHAAEERCLVSFAGAQQNVCSGKVSTAGSGLAGLTDVDAFKDSDLRLIKFDGPIDEHARASVEALGATILGYAPHYAFIVRMSAATDSRARAIRGVVWAGPFLPAFKVDSNIANELKHGNVVRDGGIEELVIGVYAHANRSAAASLLARTPGLTYSRTETAGEDTRLVARFDRAQLKSAVAQLAADSNIASVSFRWPARYFNSQADWLHQSNVNTPTPLRPVFAQGLYGCGQIVSSLDSGLFIGNCAFNDPAQNPAISACTDGSDCPTIAAPNADHRKVIAHYKWSGLTGAGPEDNHGHGTHVNGSIAGNNPANAVDCTNFTTEGGNTDLDGTAPGAKLVTQEMGATLAYLSDGGNPYHAAAAAYANGARIHSNSWGDSCTSQFGGCVANCTVNYTDYARDVDNVMRDNAGLLVLFAAGNDGTTCPNGNNVGAPANAKNLISVGANGRGTAGNTMASFSSRGPTTDARLKPDITAQGNAIMSAARNACGTLSMSGTSMATPTAAGLAALVRDYLARGFYPTGQKVQANAIANPSGAQVKAILINGAANVNAATPDQAQGWGRILLDNSLYFAGDTSKLFLYDAANGLVTNGVDVHTLDVTAGQPLNVTLTWSDVAAAVNASPALVNSLRLEVVAPNGDVWTQKLPANVGVNNAIPSQSIATTGYDNLNNVHRIRIDAPVDGTYQVRVRGINVPQGQQKYAIAATGNFQFTIAPDFALLTTPGSRTICAANPTTYDIGVLSVAGLTAPVALTVTGLPGSTTGVFSPTPVTPASPAAASILTLGNTTGVANGSYNLIVQGATTTPAITHTANVTLNVEANAPTPAALTTPADNATGASTTPAFSWTAFAGATSYRFQLSTDAGFATLVTDTVVTATSFTPAAPLNPNTQYYWRVYGINTCGESTASAVYRFTTANEICRAVVAPIPDNNAQGVTDNFAVTDTGTLTGLRLKLDIDHTYVGDLTMTLSKGATSVVLMTRPGNNGCGGNDIKVTVDDAATQTLAGNCNASTGSPAYTAGASYKGDNPLAGFAGQDLAGTWSLKLVDSANQDSGQINRWCLLSATSAGTDAIFKNGFEAVTP